MLKQTKTAEEEFFFFFLVIDKGNRIYYADIASNWLLKIG